MHSGLLGCFSLPALHHSGFLWLVTYPFASQAFITKKRKRGVLWIFYDKRGVNGLGKGEKSDWKCGNGISTKMDDRSDDNRCEGSQLLCIATTNDHGQLAWDGKTAWRCMI